jgi:hypothetical protein
MNEAKRTPWPTCPGKGNKEYLRSVVPVMPHLDFAVQPLG